MRKSSMLCFCTAAKNHLSSVSVYLVFPLVLASMPLHVAASASLNVLSSSSKTLSLNDAIVMTQNNDEWILRSELLEQRLMHMSDGASALPDPTINIGLLNLPTDGFAINQEPMTQFKVGASQMFARGDTLALEEEKYKVAASEQPHQRADRRRRMALQVTHMWMDAYLASASYRLVEDAKPLLDELGDFISASYASSLSSVNQQDIVRAQVELVQLNDRLVNINAQKRVALTKLSTFLYTQNYQKLSDYYTFESRLPNELHSLNSIDKIQISLLDKHFNTQHIGTSHLYSMLSEHPLVLALEQREQSSAIDIEIAKQAFKPQYGVNASYAVRDDAPDGRSRADFFSVGFTVSLPLFSKVRQHADVASSKKMTEAIRTEKLLLMRELMTGLSSAYQEFVGLSDRKAIYETQIIPQLTQQSVGALKSYTTDTGNFTEVIRAKIAELDAKVTLLNIEVSKRKALAQTHYYLSNTRAFGTQMDIIHE